MTNRQTYTQTRYVIPASMHIVHAMQINNTLVVVIMVLSLSFHDIATATIHAVYFMNADSTAVGCRPVLRSELHLCRTAKRYVLPVLWMMSHNGPFWHHVYF